jgi:hypothetical protein
MFERGGHAGMIFKYKGPDTRNRVIVVPARQLRSGAGIKGNGVKEEAFYFVQRGRCQNLNGRRPNMVRNVKLVSYSSTSQAWKGYSRRDNFAMRWTGSLLIRQRATYRFSLLSDDGSKLWINGAYTVNNDGLHGMRNKEGERLLGSGPHMLRLEMFERSGNAGMVLRYRGPDTRSKMIVVPTRVLRKTTRGTGLKEEVFYFGQTQRCQNLNGRRPNMARTVKAVNYRKTARRWPGLARSDQFAVRWSGSLSVKKAGVYRFFLSSDDGSKLWLDSRLAVNNDGLHAWRTRAGQRRYRAGPHSLRLEMFEKHGHAGMIFRYKGPDTGNTMIVVPEGRLQRVGKGPSAAKGLKEEQFYFGQRGRCQKLGNRSPQVVRSIRSLNYKNSRKAWPGFKQGDNFAVRWTGHLFVRQSGH